MQRIEFSVATGERSVVEEVAYNVGGALVVLDADQPAPNGGTLLTDAQASDLQLATAPSQRPVADAEFKALRETVVSRVVQLAFVASRAGNSAFESALLGLREDLLPLDSHPLVLAAPNGDLTALRAAYQQAYGLVTKAALAKAPDAAALAAWRIEIGKVFPR